MSKIPSLEEMLKLYTKKDLWERIQQHIQTIDQLKQQLEEKDKEIERLNHKIHVEEPCLIRNYKDMIEQLIQSQTQLAIQELEKVNGILTNTIIEVTQNETDLNKLCYLEEISAKFYEKMQEQIKELKGD